jgi:hypothetical protein
MEAMIFSLQGPENMGKVDPRDKDLYDSFDPFLADITSNTIKNFVREIEDYDEVEGLFSEVSSEIWRDEFKKGKRETLEDIKTSVSDAEKRLKRVVIEDEGEYGYPKSVKNKYPTKRGLEEKHKEKRSEWIKKSRRKIDSDFSRWLEENFDIGILDERIKKLTKQHGIFAREFIKNETWSNVKNQSEKEELGKLKAMLSKVVDERTQNFLNTFKKQPPKKIINSNLYDILFIRNKKYIVKASSQWYDEKSKLKSCEICGNEFRVAEIPIIYYHGSDGLKSCCLSCPIKEFPEGDELASAIRKFVDACGFIPKSNFSIISHSSMKGLDSDRKLNIIEKFAKMGGNINIRENFSSWFEALEKAGALPEGYRYGGTGVWCFAEDGHKCHSLAEQRIDNWLHRNGIDHEREPEYPEHETLNPSGQRKADWLANGDVFIEYFGMAGDEDYDLKTYQKKKLASKENIDLISIYPDDLGNLDDKLGQFVK